MLLSHERLSVESPLSFRLGSDANLKLDQTILFG